VLTARCLTSEHFVSNGIRTNGVKHLKELLTGSMVEITPSTYKSDLGGRMKT
jgi:hypothetical protein